MDERLVGALVLARSTDLWIRVVSDPYAARVAGPILEVGLAASPDVVATIGCRRLAGPGASEVEVGRLVSSRGYRYALQPWTCSARLAS